MADLLKVKGNDCLQYIHKPIGFVSHTDFITGNSSITLEVNRSRARVQGNEDNLNLSFTNCSRYTTLLKWFYDFVILSGIV